MTRFIIDANLPRSLGERLTALGHDVLDARDFDPRVLTDNEIFEIACHEKRVIITRDLDFSNPLLFPPLKSGGIIVVRTFLLSADTQIELILRFLEDPNQRIEKVLTILEAHRSRTF